MNPKRHAPARRRRGFTYTELMVAMAISTFVMVGVSTIQYVSTRMVKQIYGQARTRSSRMIAIDQIRFRLLNARTESCQVSDNGHYIQFIDPNLSGSPTSTFRFIPEERTLYYNVRTNDGIPAKPVVKGPIDVTFSVEENKAIVWLRVKSASEVAYGDVDTQDGVTAIYLRTPKQPST